MPHTPMPLPLSPSRLCPIRRAIISVTDKTGLVALCQQLLNFTSPDDGQSMQLLSTGGTYKELAKAGIAVREISDLTKFPEILGGRVKTLHPVVHAGLLSIRDNSSHIQSMTELGLPYVDLIVVNLYQFEKYAMQQPNASVAELVEHIDIGGPSMLRSAAKNFRDVVCISAPDQYDRLIKELESQKGSTRIEFRQQLALEAFARTSKYDAFITKYLSSVIKPVVENGVECSLRLSDDVDMQNGVTQNGATVTDSCSFASNEMSCCPEFSSWQSSHQQQRIECVLPLKYGLNPHQQPSCICRPPSIMSPSKNGSSNGSIPFTVLNGRPGYINFLDALNSFQLVVELSKTLTGCPPVAASFKHVSPAGVAIGGTPLTRAEIEYFDLPNCWKLGRLDDAENGTARGPESSEIQYFTN